MRRLYDPAKHCGAPVDRDIESLRAKQAVAVASREDLERIAHEQELTPQQAAKLKRLKFILEYRAKQIAEIEKNGQDDRPCMSAKGQGTDHSGVGKCEDHCECKGSPRGHSSYYARVGKDQRLLDMIDELERQEGDILNLEPELNLSRAKLRLFLEDRQDYSPETVRSLTLLVEMLRKIVETISDKRFRASISLEVFELIQWRMVEVLQKYVTDPEILDRISDDWRKIAVETSGKNKMAIASRSQS